MQQNRPADGSLWSPNGTNNRALKGKIRVRPVRVYSVSDKEFRELSAHCLCTIVWHNEKSFGQTQGWRELKFVHKTCPHHNGIEMVWEVAG
jgi:hypothetical protein